MFDLRSKGVVDRVGMVGVNGKKFPQIRAHMSRLIEGPYGLDITCETFPGDDEVDRNAYVKAAGTFGKGDVAIIFTPDDTHFEVGWGLEAASTKSIGQTQQNQNLIPYLIHPPLSPADCQVLRLSRNACSSDQAHRQNPFRPPRALSSVLRARLPHRC